MTYSNDYEYKSQIPEGMLPGGISEEKKQLLLGSKSFCIYPWIHLHATPTGSVTTCCLSHNKLASARETSLEEVWITDQMIDIGLKMLSNQQTANCHKCYEDEKHGLISSRESANKYQGKFINLIDKTQPDGSLSDFQLYYWDIRFSNLCNFKCRSCGPEYSSNWYDDQVKAWGSVPHTKMLYPGKYKTDMLEQMMVHIPYVDQIYFAGGEPLIMDDHYTILNKLIELKRTDVRLIYNTNFSELTYKKQHVFDLWKQFPSVSVGASLDAEGKRGEYMRKGTDWKQTVANRELMMKEVPHVDFYIAATISIFNAWHISDFHANWVNRGLIKPQDLNINVLQGPAYYRVDAMPDILKQRVTERIGNHLVWLEPQDTLTRATIGYKGLLTYMNMRDNSGMLPKFKEVTAILDKVRGENILDAFPELEEIYEL